MKRTLTRIISIVIILVIVLGLLTRLVMPKYSQDVVEGNMIAEFYEEKMDHDVIFIGDCEVYENFSPAVLWQEYGINSYIRGSAEQLMWQSYYLLEETLKYEKPDVVVFNVLAMEFNEPQMESYNRMTLDGMKWSMSKVNDIKASMMEDESFIEYVFPILRYHSRITDLCSDDFKYMFKRPQVSYNGYYMRVDVLPVENLPTPRPMMDYQFGDNAYKYLDMMTELCKNEGVELVLIKAPSVYPYWYPQWDEQIAKYAQENGLDYYNFLNVTDDIGIDYNTDTYDAGLHLNLSGAEKLSKYFGEILSSKYGLENRLSDAELSAIWDENIKAYNEEITRQENELNE